VRKTLVGIVSETEVNWNKNRLIDIQNQISILVKRGKMLRDSLQFIVVSVLTFIISSLLLFVDQITRISLSIGIMAIFAFGMLMLFLSCVNIIREIRSSYNAVLLDVATRFAEKQ
jgi:hypothetical protein